MFAGKLIPQKAENAFLFSFSIGEDNSQMSIDNPCIQPIFRYHGDGRALPKPTGIIHREAESIIDKNPKP